MSSIQLKDFAKDFSTKNDTAKDAVRQEVSNFILLTENRKISNMLVMELSGNLIRNEQNDKSSVQYISTSVQVCFKYYVSRYRVE
jgi:hypothetical protein